MKKDKKMIIKIVLVIVVLYTGLALYIGFKINYYVKKSIETKNSYLNSYKNFVSKEMFERLNFINECPDFDEEISVEKKISIPMVVIMPKKIEAYYWFSFNVKSKSSNNMLCGASNVPVKLRLKFRNWKWQITEYEQEA